MLWVIIQTYSNCVFYGAYCIVKDATAGYKFHLPTLFFYIYIYVYSSVGTAFITFGNIIIVINFTVQY